MNEVLIRTTIAAIEANPSQWDQRAFAKAGSGPKHRSPLECGTTACFAGWVVRIHKGDEVFADETFEWRRGWTVPESAYHAIEAEARSLLGLTDDEAAEIFYSDIFSEDIGDLKATITRVTGVTFGQEDESDG